MRNDNRATSMDGPCIRFRDYFSPKAPKPLRLLLVAYDFPDACTLNSIMRPQLVSLANLGQCWDDRVEWG